MPDDLPDERAEPLPPGAQDDVAAPLLHGTVLLAEDEPSVRRVTARMLQRLGLDVVSTTDGRAALTEFERRPGEFEAVLLDLSMPSLDGIEAFRAIRELDPGAQVLMMSGYPADQAVPGLAAEGLAGFLQKPFSFEALARQVRRLLA